MELVAKISDDPEWGWARSSGQLPELKRAQGLVQGACGPWARAFLMAESSPAFKRAQQSTAKAEVELQAMLRQASAPVAALAALCGRLSRAHGALQA
jgi:hypothetical protein